MATEAEASSLHLFSATSPAATNRRSHRCHNCDHSFYLSFTTASYALSPSSLRCPRCYHRHLLPHTISPPPPPSALPTPPPPPPLTPFVNSNHSHGSSVLTYYTSDDSDSDYDYDSDSSLISFTSPNFYHSAPALRSFVNSLSIKIFPHNSTPWLHLCSICLENFEINSNSDMPVNELPCEHYFHKDCIAGWLKRNNTCPLCRFNLPIEPDPEEGPNHWGEEHFPSELTARGERLPTSFSGAHNLDIDAASASDLGVIGGITSVSDHDATRSEEGDILVVNA